MKHCGTRKIETKRLILRQFALSDAADLLELWIADPRVQAEYGEPTYETVEAVEDLLKRWIAGYESPAFYRWAIEETDSGRCIGQIAFCRVYEDCRAAEIEYCISADYWGRGYAGEALQAVIEHTFANTDFAWLEAYHRAKNAKSGRVLEKSAMQRTETVERFRRAGETPEGEVCYRINRRYYHASRTPGLTLLEPRISKHGKPLVYASAKRENVLVYLSNAVEKHCREVGFVHHGPWRKWASYGFRDGLLELEEYWPEATAWTYGGEGGWIYTIEGDFTPQTDIPWAYTSEGPARVVGCEYVPDALTALRQAAAEEKLYLRFYEENSEKMLAWIDRITRKEWTESADCPEYRCFLEGKFPEATGTLSEGETGQR